MSANSDIRILRRRPFTEASNARATWFDLVNCLQPSRSLVVRAYTETVVAAMVVMHLQVVQQGGVMEGSAGLVETTPDLEAASDGVDDTKEADPLGRPGGVGKAEVDCELHISQVPDQA